MTCFLVLAFFESVLLKACMENINSLFLTSTYPKTNNILCFSVQNSLYKEFLVMCLPALYLSGNAFSRFMTDLGWNKDEATHLYRQVHMCIKIFIYVIDGVSIWSFIMEHTLYIWYTKQENKRTVH